MIPRFVSSGRSGERARAARSRVLDCRVSPGRHGSSSSHRAATRAARSRSAARERREAPRSWPTPGSRWSDVGAGMQASALRSSATDAERVRRPVDEERGRAETREVRDPEARRAGSADGGDRRAAGAIAPGPARPPPGGSPDGPRRSGRRARRASDPRARAPRTAARSPARSRAAPAGDGGPCGRACRKGRSQRSTATPRPTSASASATRSGLVEEEPAP